MLPYQRMIALAKTPSRKDKEQLLIDAFLANEWEFFEGCKMGLDNLITFGVKKVAEIVEADEYEDVAYDFKDFLDLTRRLQNRELTGHAARDAIHDAASRCHVPTWNHFYRRILLKDLGIGVDESTINKVLKKLSVSNSKANDYLIPVFKCQLSHDGEDVQHQKKIKGKKLIDTKLDGMRLLAVLNKESQTAMMFSRNGQVIETFPEMLATLRNLLVNIPGSLVLDGELISPQGFQHLMTLVKRKDGHPDTATIRYALFDVIPMKEFFNGYFAKSQRDRRIALESMQECGLFSVDKINDRNRIYVVPQIEVDLDTPEGNLAFSEFNRQVIADGFEGIMIKDPEAPYEGKRTSAWLKKKPTIEVTLKIIGFEPGNADGKYANTLGALETSGEDDGRMIKSNVSGGIPDDLRDEIWKNRDSYLGMMVEIIADKITLEEGASVYSLRFPRLKGFRGRTPGEKL